MAVGSKLLLYAAVSSEISQASMKDTQPSKGRKTRRMLQKSKSMTVQNFVEDICWMRVRSMDLQSADGLPPLPMHMSWVRDGILVVGMDNEMHVYSQWRGPGEEMENAVTSDQDKDTLDCRTLTEQSLQKVSSTSSLNLSVNKSFKISQSMSSIKLDASISNLSMLAEKNLKERERKRDLGMPNYKASKLELAKSDSTTTNILMNQDFGLFEAARLANPVLPQYHPRQLIELLSFGKIRRVKAILAHLVRCISGGDTYCTDEEAQQRQRAMARGMSVAGPSGGDGTTIPEESTLDYVEISSIPPLPLYALLAADDNTSFTNLESGTTATTAAATNQDYNALFDENSLDDEAVDDPFDNDEVFNTTAKPKERKRSSSQPAYNLNYFGPSQSQLLTRYLTHTHLPGLSSLDQMYLLALGDTVANTKLDFSDKQNTDMNNKTGWSYSDMIYSKTCLQGTPKYPRESVTKSHVSLYHRLCSHQSVP